MYPHSRAHIRMKQGLEGAAVLFSNSQAEDLPSWRGAVNHAL